MPKKPTKKQRRVACRYTAHRLEENEWWGKAYDQGNNRFQEGDYLTTSLENLRDITRERVNKSYRGLV